MTVVTQLVTYPLKGGRGIAARTLWIGPLGPAGDRRWMAIDPGGNLVTQREAPRLCLIAATPLPSGLRLEAPGRAPLLVPAAGPDAPAVTVRVWNDRCDAVELAPDAARWLSDFLDRPVRLVYLPDSSVRRTDPDYDPVGARVSFADGYPALVVSQASLDALNARLARPLPVNRFRPNLVVSGTRPFEEDGWRRFRIGEVPFEAVKPCARCQVPAIDQDTAEPGKEPLRTLATFRKRGSSVLFGMNAVHRGEGAIRIGDVVTVESLGPPAIPAA